MLFVYFYWCPYLCVPATTVGPDCVWIVRSSMPNRFFREGKCERLKLPQYRSTFFYRFCDIWGSHWHWSEGFVGNLFADSDAGELWWLSQIEKDGKVHKRFSFVLCDASPLLLFQCPVLLCSGKHCANKFMNCTLVNCHIDPLRVYSNDWTACSSP